MHISDWSSDVCSSDLDGARLVARDCAVKIGAVLLLAHVHDAHRALQRADGVAPLRAAAGRQGDGSQIGRASCRARVLQYVSISVAAVSLPKTISKHNQHNLLTTQRL